MAAGIDPEGFENWAIVELMGHNVIAGMVSEVQIAGKGFIRVDVPGVAPNHPAFTKHYNPDAVYCLTPTDEISAKMIVMRLAAPAIPANLARLVSGNGGYYGGE